ncbi:MAG: glycoside hydrolase family 38 C-terminal domain-containing protein, partial [Spirochaetales bacterium]|nr:glycoside hydrolase family 38 C-terminal domain-containing protein [Spirochaetales bacterium]
GGMWVEPDMNIPTGESLVRQCLYGKRFFREEFGKDLKNLWLPDVFGYSAALPQILKKAGIDHFVTQKISWNETNTFPHHTFVWTGIDGTSIDSHFLPTDTYNCSNDPEIMIASEKRYKQNDVRGGFLNLYGVGDGGGGPSRRHIEMMKRGENCQGMPRMKAARAEEFLDYLDGEDSGDLPVWQGELYLELHRGTYTTQSLMKKRNRLSEQALRDTELLQTMAMTETGSEYPRQQIEKSWKATLCNQFHDVLPGSSIAEVYEDAHRISAEVLKDLKELEDSAIAALFPEEAADQITLINTQSHSRREWIEIDGRDHQIDVPALGAVSLSLNDLKNLEEPKEKRVTWDSTSGILENEVIRIELEEDGTIGSLYMKEMAREMLKGGANRFLLYEDRPYSWDAWDVSAYYRDTVPEQAVLAGRKLVKDSKASVIIEQNFTVGKSRIIQILELRSGESLVRSECRVQWLEDEKMLRLNALPAINWPRASYEIQFGVIERPAHSNTSWDQAQFEVCGHRFADYSQTDRGLALINDCKYGYRIQDGVMELNLLRSPLYPDSGADRGDHSFAFAYMPHAGGLQSSSVQEEAFAFNSPLKMIRGRTASGTGGQSWFSMDHSAIRIESIKAAEEGSGIILRLYETKGGDARGTLSSFRPVRMAEETSLLEEKTGDLDCPDGKVMLDFHPFEIKTVRLYLS